MDSSRRCTHAFMFDKFGCKILQKQAFGRLAELKNEN